MEGSDSPARRRVRLVGLLAGPACALLCYALSAGVQITPTDPAASVPVAFSQAGRATLGLMAWMAIWWLTEAISVSVTALLPMVFLPLVTRGEFASAADAANAAAAPYAHRFIFLFMGGFILALSMERWGLHRRFALMTLRLVGARPASIIAGFMGITAFASMWVSNTASTAMMLPIALSVVHLIDEQRGGVPAAEEDARKRSNFGTALMLGIAYAASLGGIGTLIGTPPNTFLASFMEKEYGLQISFARWLGVGLPLVILFIPVTWFLLTRVVFPVSREPVSGSAQLIRDEAAGLGPMNGGERVTLVVFLLTASAWIFRPLLVRFSVAGVEPLAGLTDSGVAITAALALFVLPAGGRGAPRVMDWKTAATLPWGILVLFGGGLSLADSVKHQGVAEFIGQQARALGDAPELLVVVCVTTGVVFLTELTSNIATTATLLPILAGMAPILGIEPVLLLVPAAMAASCAFMMPVATPPNALVFGSGLVSIPQMCRAGLWLNVLGVMLVTALAYACVVPLLAP